MIGRDHVRVAVADLDTQITAVDIGGRAVAVIRGGDRWYVVDDRCSHADCAFSEDGDVDGSVLICNCHGSEYDLETGEVLVGPAYDPIRVWHVDTTDDHIEISPPEPG